MAWIWTYDTIDFEQREKMNPTQSFCILCLPFSNSRKP